MRIAALVRQFIKGEEGVTLIEYALLAALVAVAAVAVLGTLSGKLNGTFSTVSSDLP